MHAGKDSSPPVTSAQHKLLYNINGWLMSWADTVIVLIMVPITVITISIMQNLHHHHLPSWGDNTILKIITPPSASPCSITVLCGFSDFVSSHFLAATQYNESFDHYCQRSYAVILYFTEWLSHAPALFPFSPALITRIYLASWMPLNAEERRY